MSGTKAIVRAGTLLAAIAAGLFLWHRFVGPLPDLQGWLQRATGTASHATAYGSPRTRDLTTNLKIVLSELEADTADISSQLFLEERTRELEVRIPRGLPPEQVVWMLSTAVDRTAYQLSDCVRLSEDAYHLLFSSRRASDEKIRLMFSWASRYYSRTARIAFLIQNFGFEANKTTTDILSYPQPLTVSLVPTEGTSAWTARIADHYRKEIVILLPLEPRQRVSSPYADRTLLVHQSEHELVAAISDAAEAIPNFTGFANLWGSRFLEDSRATSVLLSQVKRRNGYFVDAESTPASLAPELARTLGLPCRQVDASLERGLNAQALAERMPLLVTRAQRNGSLLVTVEPSSAFIEALQDSEAMLAHNGVKLVYVSQIVIHPDG